MQALCLLFKNERCNKMEEMKHKNDCKGDSCKVVKGVSCDVRNCAYHSGMTTCTAGSITVGPCEANCSANTSCATFKPKTI